MDGEYRHQHHNLKELLHQHPSHQYQILPLSRHLTHQLRVRRVIPRSTVLSLFIMVALDSWLLPSITVTSRHKIVFILRISSLHTAFNLLSFKTFIQTLFIHLRELSSLNLTLITVTSLLPFFARTDGSNSTAPTASETNFPSEFISFAPTIPTPGGYDSWDFTMTVQTGKNSVSLQICHFTSTFIILLHTPRNL